ncbi:hypothetical protein BX600DRAFT_517805 [Xylariales sp. PMI_506]|nr:hypothetical protein BX600DRAFT_517805 [Xylariales sp. PMI_506]
MDITDSESSYHFQQTGIALYLALDETVPAQAVVALVQAPWVHNIYYHCQRVYRVVPNIHQLSPREIDDFVSIFKAANNSTHLKSHNQPEGVASLPGTTLEGLPTFNSEANQIYKKSSRFVASWLQELQIFIAEHPVGRALDLHQLQADILIKFLLGTLEILRFLVDQRRISLWTLSHPPPITSEDRYTDLAVFRWVAKHFATAMAPVQLSSREPAYWKPWADLLYGNEKGRQDIRHFKTLAAFLDKLKLNISIDFTNKPSPVTAIIYARQAAQLRGYTLICESLPVPIPAATQPTSSRRDTDGGDGPAANHGWLRTYLEGARARYLQAESGRPQSLSSRNFKPKRDTKDMCAECGRVPWCHAVWCPRHIDWS